MIIALAQLNIVWEDQCVNMKKIQDFIKQASEKNAELILFPEMSLTGFTMNVDKLALSEEEILKEFQKIAVGNNINIGFGFAVKLNEKGANKYAIISKNGEVLVNYTKIHPFSYSGEDKKYLKGDEVLNCKINEFTVTPFICYDLRFPELFQIASKKSQIITVAASWPKSRENHWITLLRARAIENQCFVLGVNRVGEGNGLEYNGASIFVNPDGNILTEINSEEGLIIYNIDINEIIKVRSRFDIKSDRREDLYYSYFGESSIQLDF